MRHSIAASMKTKVGYHATVAEYTLLKTATDVLVVKLSKKDKKAKRDPVGINKTHTRTQTGKKISLLTHKKDN